MKTEDSHVSDAAGPPPSILGAQRVTTILDHDKSMARGKLKNRIHLRRMTGVINWKHRPRARRDPCRGFLRIKVERVSAYVGENRGCSLVQHAVCRSGKRQRSRDCLIARLEPRCESSAVQCRRTRTETDRMLGSNAGSQCFLEFPNLGPRGEPTGAQHAHHILDVIFRNRLSSIRKKRLPNRSSSIDGEQFFAGRYLHLGWKILGDRS
jgi:hypothetical protein